jgi:hypothetical protein
MDVPATRVAARVAARVLVIAKVAMGFVTHRAKLEVSSRGKSSARVRLSAGMSQSPVMEFIGIACQSYDLGSPWRLISINCPPLRGSPEGAGAELVLEEPFVAGPAGLPDTRRNVGESRTPQCLMSDSERHEKKESAEYDA